MKRPNLEGLKKKWWLWAFIGVLVLSIITGEGSIGLRMNKSQALEEAEEMLRYSAYSYDGLVEELTEYRGFTEGAAVYAADHCGADWYGQAAKAAEDYFDGRFSSEEDVRDNLEWDGFTKEQIAYALG